MCARVRIRFGDVAVLLRSSKDQKVRKHESEKRWKKLDLAHVTGIDWTKDGGARGPPRQSHEPPWREHPHILDPV